LLSLITKKLTTISQDTNLLTLSKATLFSLLLQFAAALIHFLLLIFLARLLGVQGYGNYIYVLAWINILVLLAKFGLDLTLVRYVAAYESQQQWSYLRGVIIWSFKVTLLLTVFINCLLLSALWLLADKINSQLVDLFLIGTVLIFLLSIIELYQGILRGLHRVLLSFLVKHILRPLFLGIIVLFLYLFKISLSSQLTMVMHTCAALLVFIIATRLVIHCLPVEVKISQTLFKDKEWLITALPLFFIIGSYMIMSQTDIVMLGILKKSEISGIYSAVVNITTFVTFGLTAFNNFAAPMVSKLHTLGKQKALQQMLSFAAWGILGFAVTASLFLMITGKWLLSLFGSAFIQGYPVLILLLLGQIINALSGSVNLIATMTGHQIIAAQIIAMGAGLNVLLNLILIPQWGMLGAAIATSLTTIFWNLVLLRFVHQQLGINPTVLPLKPIINQ